VKGCHAQRRLLARFDPGLVDLFQLDSESGPRFSGIFDAKPVANQRRAKLCRLRNESERERQ
jgi:hypothetical protein